MFKSLKIFFLTFILFFCTFSCVQAMDINMNLYNTNTSNTSSATNNTSTLNSVNNQTSYSNDDYSVSLSSMPESELGFENILNIILIVVGILLIFLGIAIMIRLK